VLCKAKVSWREIDGILLLDKPKGISSNAALQIVKRLFKAKKAGHTGSLDPIASGLLPICFGEATKFSRFLLEADKHYQTTALLGIQTDTGDAEGNIVNESLVPNLNIADVETILDRFRGNISQIPSMFSAIKHQGQPLYKLARQGIVIDREARKITIKDLKLTELKNNTMRLEIRATKGTYVRTLVEDIGQALGCGAHVVELRRLGSGPYTAEQMLSFEILENILAEEGMKKLDGYLMSVNTSLATMPELRVSNAASYYLRQGQPVQIPYAPTSGWVQLSLQNGRFLGVGEILEDGRVAPRRLTQEVVSL
jgi:tRNA pseudouridine55 synthase